MNNGPKVIPEVPTSSIAVNTTSIPAQQRSRKNNKKNTNQTSKNAKASDTDGKAVEVVAQSRR
jgi:hypothetical protein